MKRWVILLICLLCWEKGFSATVEHLSTDERFKYKLYSEGGLISDYLGSDAKLIIPTKIDENAIIEVGQLATTNTTTDLIYVPNGIKIDKQAFNVFSKLQTIILVKESFYNPSNSSGICYQNDDQFTVNNIIIFNKNADGTISDVNYYIGENKSSKYSSLFEIKYKNNSETPIIIYMYILGNNFTENNLKALKSALEINSSNLSSITEIDLTAVPCSFNSGFNPAMLFPNAAIVTAGGTFENNHTISITDLTDFTAVDESIVFEKYQYTRDKTANWNSVCLPFPIKESMFPADTKIYTLNETQDVANHIKLKRTTTKVEAGTPCYIHCSSTTTSWNLTNIEKSSVVNVVPENEAGRVTQGDWSIIGYYKEKTIDANKYKLNSEGTAFGITTAGAIVAPYRCYLQSTSSSSAPARLSVSLEEPDGTTETVSLDEIMREQDEAPATAPQLYDLFGRPRSPGSAGIFVRPTRH